MKYTTCRRRYSGEAGLTIESQVQYRDFTTQDQYRKGRSTRHLICGPLVTKRGSPSGPVLLSSCPRRPQRRVALVRRVGLSLTALIDAGACCECLSLASAPVEENLNIFEDP